MKPTTRHMHGKPTTRRRDAKKDIWREPGSGLLAAIKCAASNIDAGDYSLLDNPVWLESFGRSFIERLLWLAKAGDENAALLLCGAILHATKELRSFTLAHPQLVRDVSAGFDEWPIIATRYFFRDRPHASQREVKTMLQSIGVIAKAKTENPDQIGAKIARQLFNHVASAVRGAKLYGQDHLRMWNEPVAKAARTAMKHWPLTKENYALWFKLAKPIALFGRFEDREVFARFWRTEQVRKTPHKFKAAKVRDEICRAVKTGFRSIAQTA